MKGCRSTEDVRKAGAHLVAQLRDMLEIDGYELLTVRICDRQTGISFYWSDWKPQEGEKDGH
nr:MAG TPA: hypothetical protein [Caudoviricetes sp.]